MAFASSFVEGDLMKLFGHDFGRFLLAALMSLTAVGLVARAAGAAAHDGIHKIKHVIVIMQENRSFDSYFGTFPGADGFPMVGTTPNVCVPDPKANDCVRPYHETHDQNAGGPHDAAAADQSIDGGRMDGFIKVAEGSRDSGGCPGRIPTCSAKGWERAVLGYHTAAEIPNYWAYAKNFVLQDHMFEPVRSWSLPAHLYMVSEWAASCTRIGDPTSCKPERAYWNKTDLPRDILQINDYSPIEGRPDYPWTDLTYLLHAHHVSWAYYVMDGFEPDCANNAASCNLRPQTARTPGIWNPLPSFTDVKEDGELSNIKDTTQFFTDVKSGQLPAVVWLTPGNRYSEHPPGLVSAGQAYVTGVINAVMRSTYWDSTAIFLSWDDWGGFYDHMGPPNVNFFGYGLRVPGLVISAYARKGYIDHQTLSHDAYVKFIEDDFLQGQRLDPKTDGRPDPRETVAESVEILGDLRNDFDFGRQPRKPLLLHGGIEPPYKSGLDGPP